MTAASQGARPNRPAKGWAAGSEAVPQLREFRLAIFVRRVIGVRRGGRCNKKIGRNL
ncbi:MAG: hypothetical protein KKC25_01955 [Proteobacteria bacterium]|nr:hypothetical protein [Pseudomonadota bacterium]